MGDDIEGKPHMFMPYSGGVRSYRRILEDVVANGYRGFRAPCEHRNRLAPTVVTSTNQQRTTWTNERF